MFQFCKPLHYEILIQYQDDFSTNGVGVGDTLDTLKGAFGNLSGFLESIAAAKSKRGLPKAGDQTDLIERTNAAKVGELDIGESINDESAGVS